jgi:cytochrome c6
MKKNLMMMAMMGIVAAQAGAQAPDGKALFAKNCAACHQATGAGIPGAFPALKANKFVQGDANEVISTVLKGRAGMPTFAAALDDDQLSLVLSYVRSSWGNKGAAVAAADVTAVRSASNAGATVVQDQPTNVH